MSSLRRLSEYSEPSFARSRSARAPYSGAQPCSMAYFKHSDWRTSEDPHRDIVDLKSPSLLDLLALMLRVAAPQQHVGSFTPGEELAIAQGRQGTGSEMPLVHETLLG